MEYLIRLVFLIALLGGSGEPAVTQMEYTIRADMGIVSLEELDAWIDQEEIDLNKSRSILEERWIELDARNDELEALEYELDIVRAAYPDLVLPNGVYEDYQEKLDRFNVLVDEFNDLNDLLGKDTDLFNERNNARNEAIDKYNRLLKESEE